MSPLNKYKYNVVARCYTQFNLQPYKSYTINCVNATDQFYDSVKRIYIPLSKLPNSLGIPFLNNDRP